eukprot:753299-Pelagomonas_calceolata.AAC.4
MPGDGPSLPPAPSSPSRQSKGITCTLTCIRLNSITALHPSEERAMLLLLMPSEERVMLLMMMLVMHNYLHEACRRYVRGSHTHRA